MHLQLFHWSRRSLLIANIPPFDHNNNMKNTCDCSKLRTANSLNPEKLLRKFSRIKLVPSGVKNLMKQYFLSLLLDRRLVKASSVINLLCSKEKPAPVHHVSLFLTNTQTSQNDRCLEILYSDRTDISPIMQNSSYKPAQIFV